MLRRHGARSRGNLSDTLGLLQNVLTPRSQPQGIADSSFIVLADLPTIEHVLTKQTRAIDRAAQTTEIFAGLAPTGQIALPTNEMWKHHRRIVGPAMTSKYLSLTTPLANEAVTDVIDYFKAKIIRANGRAWSVEKDMEGATLVSTGMIRRSAQRQDAICAMAFGSSWGSSMTYREQVLSASDIPTGALGEAVFTVRPPELHESMLYLFEARRREEPRVSLAHCSPSTTSRRIRGSAISSHR